MNCVGLDFAKNFFLGVKQESEQRVRQLQSSFDCGDRDAMTSEFFETAPLPFYLYMSMYHSSHVTVLAIDYYSGRYAGCTLQALPTPLLDEEQGKLGSGTAGFANRDPAGCVPLPHLLHGQFGVGSS